MKTVIPCTLLALNLLFGLLYEVSSLWWCGVIAFLSQIFANICLIYYAIKSKGKKN